MRPLLQRVDRCTVTSTSDVDAVQIALRRITRARAAVAASTAGAVATRSFDGAGGVPPKAISSIPIAVQIIATAIASRGCTATTRQPSDRGTAQHDELAEPAGIRVDDHTDNNQCGERGERDSARTVACRSDRHDQKPACRQNRLHERHWKQEIWWVRDDEQRRAREAGRAGEALASSRPRQQDDQQPDHVKRDGFRDAIRAARSTPPDPP